MRYRRACVILLGCILIATGVIFAQDTTSIPTEHRYKQVSIIPIKGTINFGLSAFIKRALRESPQSDLIIFDIDTLGGELNATFLIVETILGVKHAKTVGFVNPKAISAGAFIALSCNEIVMAKNATIGDCAPITFGQKGMEILGEKVQSPLRAKFRTLARTNKYPIRLAEAMITPDLEVVQVRYKDGSIEYLSQKEYEELPKEKKDKVETKKTVIEKDKLLTMDETEAINYGFASKIVSSMDDLEKEYEITDTDKVTFKESGAETLVRFLNTIAPILLIIGFLALWVEITTPGLGIPGLTALICFALLFGSKYLIGLASYAEMFLFAVGIALLFIELFIIPGFGVTGITGIILIILSLYLAFEPFIIPRFPWEVAMLKRWFIEICISGGIIAIGIYFVAKHIGKIPYLRLLVLDSHVTKPEEAALQHEKTYDFLLNKKGTAASDLRPTGRIAIEEDFYDAVTEGEYITKETPIVVMEVHGNRIVVQPDKEAQHS